MLQRIITAVVLIAILLPLLFLSWQCVYIIPALVALMALAAVYELLKCLRSQVDEAGTAATAREDFVVSIPAYLIAVGLPLATAFVTSIHAFLLAAAAVFTLYLLYLFAVAVLRQGRMHFAEVAEVFTGVLYITLSFASLSLLRHKTPPAGGYLYLLVFFGAWVTDTFAYFTGRFFGKHKLNPVISPKKTVEGSIGGILFCMISFVLFGIVMQFGKWHFTVHYPLLLLSGLLCSVVSQVGDLITSLIKREHGVKDYGKIFPGHGGVLDRFDSVLAISPVLLILSNLSLLGDTFALLS